MLDYVGVTSHFWVTLLHINPKQQSAFPCSVPHDALLVPQQTVDTAMPLAFISLFALAQMRFV
jgi:hypothetical protein